jgi:hypothetical protein
MPSINPALVTGPNFCVGSIVRLGCVTLWCRRDINGADVIV